MRFLVVCFALAGLPTCGGSDCQGERDVISSLSATIESQLRTIRALEEELAAVTAAQAECYAMRTTSRVTNIAANDLRKRPLARCGGFLRR